MVRIVLRSRTEWQRQLADNRPISRVSLPGTHDSCAVSDDLTFLENLFAGTQEWSLAAQLNAGIRYFDIRLRFHEPKEQSMDVHHGSQKTKYTLFRVLTIFTNFLKDHPSEFIVMKTQPEETIAIRTGEPFQAQLRFEISHFDPENRFYLEPKIPTVRQARGKIVLINRMRTEDSVPYGIDYPTSSFVQDIYTLSGKPLPSKADPNPKWGSLERKWETARVLFDKCKDYWQFDPLQPFVNHMSGNLGIPPGGIDAIASAMLGHLDRWLNFFEPDGTPVLGWIPMDFPTMRIVERIIETNSTD